MFALVKTESVTNPQTQVTSDVEIIKLFAPYTIWEDKNGTQYGPDHLISLTADQKQDLGIYDVAYSNTRADDRFYNVAQNNPQFDQAEKIVKITYTSTPKQLEDSDDEVPVLGLKSQWIANYKGNVNSILSQTDWMLVRKIERNINVPAAIVTYRAAVVAECNRLETAISAATTIEQLTFAVDSANFPSAE